MRAATMILNWRIVSDESRTDLLLQLLDRETPETAQDAIQACLGQAESL